MNGNELLDRIRPVEHRLENGLTLLVREDHTAPVVAIVTHVRAGYFDEPDRLVGISHVLEHMYFKGTERRGVGEIARETKTAGGYLNAGTIYDHTSYYTVLPSSAVDMGLDVQADALLNSRLDEEELRKELLVIIQEVNRKLDSPSALASEKLYEAMFDVHPMRRWRMGTEATLKELDRVDLVEYYRRMYRAGNITLVVAGDVDARRVVERVEALYAPLPGGEPERTEVTEPERSGARYRELTGDIGHSYAELGWRGPGALDPDTPALDALAVVLGQGRASRLYRRVRDRGLASSIDAYNYTPRGIGVFGISIEAESATVADALRATIREIDGVRDRPVDPEELDRVRTLLQARILRRLETAQGQANLLADWEALEDWRRAGAFLDAIRTLTPDDLRAAARRYLDPGDVTLLVYRPEDGASPGWTDAGLTEALRDGGSEPRGTGEPPPETDDPASGSGADTAGTEAASGTGAPVAMPAPVVLGAPTVEDGVVQHDLEGGRLVIKPRSRAPLVSLAIMCKGGVVHEDAGSAGVSGLMMRSSVKGTAGRSAERIARESESLGGAISAAAGADLFSWSLTVPSEHFRAGFDLLADVAFHPTFPVAEVRREREVLLADLDQLRDDMYRYPLRLMLAAAFPRHPYGHGLEQVAEAVGAIGPDRLRSWHAEQLAEPWVLVVGDIEPDRVADTVAARVGSPTRALGLRAPTPRWPASPVTRSVRRDRAQTALALGFPGPDRRDDDRIPLQVLASAVSGLGNRLFEELRSRRSLAYTVTAYPLTRRHGGAFVGYIATSPDRAEEARKGLIEELLRLREEPPSEEAVDRARSYTIGAWQIRTQTNRARLAELAESLILGGGLEELQAFEARVRRVSRDDLRAVAQRWFDPDRLVEGAVHGRAETGSAPGGSGETATAD